MTAPHDGQPDHRSLWEGFCSPPDEARPRVWWHWMDGNVDPEGIRLDLRWLQSVGVRGVQVFNGGLGTPLVVPERVHQGSEAWREAVRLAETTAHELGLEFTVATSAGWSATGGPWVRPRDAMKKVVWSSTPVEGGRVVEQRLAGLPDVAGPYQDSVRWGTDPDAHRFVQDWAVVAVPAGTVPTALTPASVRTSSPIGGSGCLLDGAFAEFVSLPRDPDGPSAAWLEQVFDEPVQVSAVTVGLPGPQGFAAAPPPTVVLEASDDGETYRVVASVDAPGSKYRAVPVRTVAFPPVTARRFRLRLHGESAAAALPPFSEGIRVPPILRKVAEFRVSEFALFAGGRVHHAEVKAGFAAAADYYALEAPAAATASIDPEQVLDLTGCLGADGVLRWDAPEGLWHVLRFGASLTGQTNGPAPADATGLEVDKLDGNKVRGYLETYLELFDGVQLDALLSDSIEAGPQNHTDRLRERFAELRGYDPVRWLPALAGHVVGDAGRTDAFLYDFRRTIADLLAREYYGTLAQEAHRRGLLYYAEALENRRPQLGDDLAMRSHADVPMGAMWLFDADGGSPDPTYLADLKGASSVAHVYGKPFTGAEAMTAFHRPWSYTPKRLKHVADLQFALGVTRVCIHTSPHQPTQVPPPGIGLAPFLGQTFIRTEPWAELAGPWIDYLARCSWLLNQGVPAVDVAVFVGEEAPVTALFGDEPDRSVPDGFDHDYVDLDALEQRVGVVDGALAAGATRYRVLHLGGSSARMTVRALRRLAALVGEGATVVGRRPVGSPSLADDAAEHARLRDEIWSAESVVDTDDLSAALERLGVRPALVVEGAELLRIGRRVGDREIVFLANPSPEPVSVTLRAAWPGAPALWDPVTLRRTALHGDRLTLPGLGSVFVLPGGPVDDERGEPEEELALDGDWTLALPGLPSVALPGGPRPWTELGREAIGFAGIGTYATEFDVPAGLLDDRAVLLSFGDVGDLARVRVNGTDCGVVWTEPWELDVTAALRPGRNTVEVEVANAWMNRLITDAAAPTGEIFPPVAEVYLPDAPLQECGLRGPVVLRSLT